MRGEAGAGKTALVSRFCDDQAGRVLEGACDPLFTPRPLGPFLDIARSAGGELARVASTTPRPYELAGALMTELDERGPSIVVLEDVHWADEATLDVLRIVTRRIESLPGAPRRHLPSRRARSPPSPPGAARRGDGRPPDGADRGRIALARRQSPRSQRTTASMPPTCTGRPEGTPSSSARRSPPGEASCRRRCGMRCSRAWRRLSPGARELLEAIAVDPMHAELWLLEELAPDSADSLEECLASGMLRAERERRRVPARACPARRRRLAPAQRPQGAPFPRSLGAHRPACR